MRFIELHNRDGVPILINVYQIISIARYDDEITDLVCCDGITSVRETPDEIILKIRG